MAAWLADLVVLAAVVGAAGYWLRRLRPTGRPAGGGCSSCAACSGCAAATKPAPRRQSR